MSFAVIAAGAYAVYIFLMGLATRAAGRTALPMFVSTGATALTAGAYGLVSGTLDLTPSLVAQGWLVLLALVSQVIGWLLVASASQRLPASAVAASLVLQSASALLFGAVLLAQTPTLVQLAGAGMILAGGCGDADTREEILDDCCRKTNGDKRMTTAADHIYINGDIRAMDGAVGDNATAVAVKDGRFVALGTDAEISALTDSETSVVDLAGRWLFRGSSRRTFIR
ncbi:EamA family transporter [Rhodococcus sp. 3Y1]